MSSGGARARSGPAPDPDALRSRRPSEVGDWETLPGPRTDPTPEWPLVLGEPSPEEVEVWAREWLRPQAWKWELHGQELEVALYVRTLLEAGQPGAASNMRTVVVRMQETLGISLSGLARNRWRIGEPVRDAGLAGGGAVARAADRGLTVVKGGG